MPLSAGNIRRQIKLDAATQTGMTTMTLVPHHLRFNSAHETLNHHCCIILLSRCSAYLRTPSLRREPIAQQISPTRSFISYMIM